MNETIAEKIVKLRLHTRRACMCENLNSEAKSTLTLKSKLLYLIKDGNSSPNDIMNKLNIGKTNLAFIAKQLETEGMIIKTVSKSDRRHIEYRLTDKGEHAIADKLNIIEKQFKNILTSEAEYNKALEDLDKVIELLSYL